MFQERLRIWRDLTGQRLETLEFMNSTVNVNDPVVRNSITTFIGGLKWASDHYEYQATQLLDLVPGGRVVRLPPFSGWPPPNLLLGYRYVAYICENYLFDRRMFSNFTYEARENRRKWNLLTDCSYTINVGAMGRMLSEDRNFGESATQIQNAVLMDRVVRSLSLTDERMQGYGLQTAVTQQNMARTATPVGGCDFTTAYRLSSSGKNDVAVLKRIWNLKRALMRYLIELRKNNKMDLRLDDRDWILKFEEMYGQTNEPSTEEKALLTTQDLVLLCVLGKRGMSGGAITLRSGTRVGLPMRLRPRRNFRAVTGPVYRFMDSLPPRRRRRGTQRSVQPENREESSDRRFETNDLSREEIEENDRGSDPEVEEQEEEEADNIIRIISNLITMLEEELTPNAIGSNFFEFADAFMEAMERAVEEDRATETYVLHWALYFFVMEHIGSTLYYLHEQIHEGVGLGGREYFGISFAQIIMRARDETGGSVFNRVWYSGSQMPLQDLNRRITTDMVAIAATAESGPMMGPEDFDQLLQEPAFVDRSGDVGDLITQVTNGIVSADSIELSFRVKYNGFVTFARNAAIRLSAENEYEMRQERQLQRRQRFAAV